MAEAAKTIGRLGWLTATIGPPGAVAGLWPGWVQDNPVLAVVLLVVYEAVLAVVAFVREVASELIRRWQARFIERVDQTLGRRLFRFERRYREFVLGALRFIDLKGLATIGPYTPQLDEVFVELGLVPRSPHQVVSDPLADVPAELTERSSLHEFLSRSTPEVLAVVGAAGSGKTTLLRHTARRICHAGGKQRRPVPIFLFLRDHSTEILADPEVPLADLLRGTLGRYRPDEPAGWFEQKLRDGDCVVLLDGLDEVTPRGDRRAVSDWVERQIGQYPGNDYVITSRPHGYWAAEIVGATVLQVRRFTDEQVARFVRGWYWSMERHSTGTDNGEMEPRVASAADDLLDRLRNATGLYELTVNPLLLTMIANVHHYRSALPGSRAELYSEICEVMLWRRHSAKKLPIELGGDQKELLLRQLAFTMMERRVRDLPKAEVLEVLKPLLRRVSKELTGEEFLAEVGSSGLLIERENGLHSFAHHTFQEYLAAAHIQDKGPVDLLPGLVDDEWWRECTLLYAARADTDPIIRACLDSASVPALALAFDCAQHAREIDPALRESLDRLLESCYEPDIDPRRRRLMAHVMVTRHLRHLTPTDGVARICARPISVDIYRLFLADTGTSPPDDPRPFRPGSGGPVVGVHPADVLTFVHWINQIAGGGSAYRLPRRAEVEVPAVRRALDQPDSAPPGRLSVWLEPHGTRALELWTPEPAQHPHLIKAEVLVRAVTGDLRASAATLARLLLARSLVVLRAVAFDLEHGVAGARARNLAGDLVHGLARALDLALARSSDLGLARTLNPALAHAFDLARAVDREVDHARALNLARLRDLARIRAIDLALALDLALGRAFTVAGSRPDSERDLVHDLDRALDRDFEYARRLASTLDTDLDTALEPDLDLVLDVVLGLDLARDTDRTPVPFGEYHRHLEAITGLAMPRALSQALQESERVPLDEDRHRFLDSFARAFVTITGIESGDRIVPPDSLTAEVRRACSGLLAASPVPDWAREASDRLERLAVPVFSRRQNLTPVTATAIRTGVLCLAVEADALGAPSTAEAFRQVAAGVSLLEQRWGSELSPTETIVLATA
ncbi:NACHT domain-containing protein [Amycolatopsis nigrescens]|uniref:NACHT domain-containing protein n=1 Tax=Amycolatopsis nigrescens TaxID=381445 RepID=UPI000380B7AD|nr:NACHT domain-containing protein [Amycolatopsis nigrescens]